MLARQNKFSGSSVALRSHIASWKNCPNLLFSSVYVAINSLFFLIHAFNIANDVSIGLKSGEYGGSLANNTLALAYISFNSLFQCVLALSKTSTDRGPCPS